MRIWLAALAAAVLGIMLSASVGLAYSGDEAVVVEGAALPTIRDEDVRDGRAFGVKFEGEKRAQEINYNGESTFYIVLENTGTTADVITVDIQSENDPPEVLSFEWFSNYCDEGGVCHFGPNDYALAAGERETLDVHMLDQIGDTIGRAKTTLTATSNGDPGQTDAIVFGTFIETPSILLVDDDGGGSDEIYMQNAIDEAGYFEVTADAANDDFVDLGDFVVFQYRMVLWTTGGGDATYITGDIESAWTDYLDGGGMMFIASAEYLSSRGGPTTFTSDYLHLDSWDNDVGGSLVTGSPGHSISDGMVLNLTSVITSSDDGLGNPDFPDDSFFDSAEGSKGIDVGEDGHRIVFIPFPFENVSTSDSDPNNQKTLIKRVIESFAPTTGVEDGEHEVARLALRQNFPNPFNPKTTIEFAVPAGAAHVNLVVHNVNGQVVRTLVDGAKPAGPQSEVWDGVDDAGRDLASGIYFARLTIDGETASRKMALLK